MKRLNRRNNIEWIMFFTGLNISLNRFVLWEVRISLEPLTFSSGEIVIEIYPFRLYNNYLKLHVIIATTNEKSHLSFL